MCSTRPREIPRSGSRCVRMSLADGKAKRVPELVESARTLAVNAGRVSPVSLLHAPMRRERRSLSWKHPNPADRTWHPCPSLRPAGRLWRRRGYRPTISFNPQKVMPDDPIGASSDRTLISLERDEEVRGLAESLGCSEQELREAVSVVGPSADEVRRYLSYRRR